MLTIAPQKEDISFVRGNNFTFTLVFYTDDKKDKLVFNPDTDDVIFAAKKESSNDFILVKHLNSGITESDGEYTVNIESEDTKDLDYGNYEYNVTVIIGKDEENPFVRTTLFGSLLLLPYDYSGGDSNE